MGTITLTTNSSGGGSSAVTSTFTRYVSAFGSNATGDGSQSKPFATLARAISGAQYPLTIWYDGQSLTENLSLTSANNNINIRSMKSMTGRGQADWNGAITTGDGFQYFGIEGFNIKSGSSAPISLGVGDLGSHVIKGCSFVTTAASYLTYPSGFNGVVSAIDCDFTGNTLTTALLLTSSAGAKFNLVNSGAIAISIGSGNQVYVSGTTALAHVAAPHAMSVVGDFRNVTVNEVISTQARLTAIAALTSGADGIYAINFASPTGVLGVAKGDLIFKTGAAQYVVYPYRFAPATMDLLSADGVSRSLIAKSGSAWVQVSGATGRNRIANGSLMLTTPLTGLGTSGATLTAGADAAISVFDKMWAACTGANVNLFSVAGVSASDKRAQFNGASSVTGIKIGTRIPAVECQDLGGALGAFSVDLANSLLTSVTWTAYYANTADSFGTLATPTKTQIATGTFTVSSTVARYGAMFSLPASVTNGIEIVLSVGAQISGTWTIGKLKFERGSVPTDYETPTYNEELARVLPFSYAKVVSKLVSMSANTNVVSGDGYLVARVTDSSTNGAGTAGMAGLALMVQSGTATVYKSGCTKAAGGSFGTESEVALSLSTSPTMVTWNYGGAGDFFMGMFADRANNRIYRITMTIGGGYNNCSVTIERLN